MSARRSNKETPLHLAAKHGHLEIAKLLVKKGAAVDTRDLTLSTPLILAAQYNHAQVVEYLIKWLVEIFAANTLTCVYVPDFVIL